MDVTDGNLKVQRPVTPGMSGEKGWERGLNNSKIRQIKEHFFPSTLLTLQNMLPDFYYTLTIAKR